MYEKSKETLRVLLPGLQLKRWLIVVFVGLLQMAIGTTIWIGNGLRQMGEWPLVKLLTFRFLPRVFRGALFFGVGSALTYVGWQQLSRSLMRVISPEQPEGDLRQFLVQRQQAQRGRRVVVIGGEPGLSPILTTLQALPENIRLDVILSASEQGYQVQELQQKFGLPNQQVFFPSRDTASLYAELEDGRLLEGATTINRFSGGQIKNLFLSRDLRRVQVWEAKQNGKSAAERLQDYTPSVAEAVLDVIAQAEWIIFAPGLLYTQILSNLSMSRFAQAIAESSARKIYVANLMTEPGRTDGWGITNYIETIHQLGQIKLDYAIVHDGPISETMLKQYHQEGADKVPSEIKESASQLIFVQTGEEQSLIDGVVILRHDVVTEGPQVVTLTRGYDTILREMPVVRHDPEKLAPVLQKLLNDEI